MRKGIILIAIYGVITVLAVFSASLVFKVSSEKKLLDRNTFATQARYLADSGLDHAFLWLKEQPSYPSGISPIIPDELQNVSLGEGADFSVTIDPYDTNMVQYVKRYKITATGTISGVSRELSMDVVMDTFARYAYFTDIEIYSAPWKTYTVWFTSNDHIRGPLHTNDQLHISGDPVFDDIVCSVDDEVAYYNGGPPQDNPQFDGGLELGAEAVNFPLAPTALKNAASSSGLELEGNTMIVLNSNGTMNVTNAAKGWSNKNMSLPANGAVFVNNGDVEVSGTLDGQLTIGSEQNILISNDIVYKDDPRTDPASTDMLGLIAEEDVVIDHNAEHDLEIDASVMALGNNFIYDEWWNGPPKGTLEVLGGIIQKERGPVGTFNGSTGQKQSGYSKDYTYDQRLMNQHPPFFPLTNRYSVVLWKENH